MGPESPTQTYLNNLMQSIKRLIDFGMLAEEDKTDFCLRISRLATEGNLRAVFKYAPSVLRMGCDNDRKEYMGFISKIKRYVEIRNKIECELEIENNEIVSGLIFLHEETKSIQLIGKGRGLSCRLPPFLGIV